MSSPSTSPRPPEPTEEAPWRQDAHNRADPGDTATEEQTWRLRGIADAVAAAGRVLWSRTEVVTVDAYADEDGS